MSQATLERNDSILENEQNNTDQEEIDNKILTMIEKNIVQQEENRRKYKLDDCINDIKDQMHDRLFDGIVQLPVNLRKDSYQSNIVDEAFDHIKEWLRNEDIVFDWTSYVSKGIERKYRLSFRRRRKRKRSSSIDDESSTDTRKNRKKLY